MVRVPLAQGSRRGYLVLLWSTSKGWKTVSIMEPPSDFEPWSSVDLKTARMSGCQGRLDRCQGRLDRFWDITLSWQNIWKKKAISILDSVFLVELKTRRSSYSDMVEHKTAIFLNWIRKQWHNLCCMLDLQRMIL